MRIKNVLAPLVVAIVVMPAADALELALGRRTIEQALDIAHSTIRSTHVRFHADYRFPVARPPIDFVEIVSPFRRVVLAAETNQQLGRRMFGQQEALAALQPDPERVEVYVELTFHPMNTFVSVPEYDVDLLPVSSAGSRVQPATIDRLARYGPRLDDSRYPFPYPYTAAPRVPSGTQPLLGATLIARFDGGLLDPRGVYEVVVRDAQTELGRSRRIDLLRLR